MSHIIQEILQEIQFLVHDRSYDEAVQLLHKMEEVFSAVEPSDSEFYHYKLLEAKILAGKGNLELSIEKGAQLVQSIGTRDDMEFFE